jgi:hypothetical protein
LIESTPSIVIKLNIERQNTWSRRCKKWYQCSFNMQYSRNMEMNIYHSRSVRERINWSLTISIFDIFLCTFLVTIILKNRAWVLLVFLWSKKTESMQFHTSWDIFTTLPCLICHIDTIEPTFFSIHYCRFSNEEIHLVLHWFVPKDVRAMDVCE